MSTIKIISGGQAGVDIAALDAALEAGLLVGGWCPPGRTALHGPISKKYPLIETPLECSSSAPEVPRSMRTEWNIREADATLVLHPENLLPGIGTQYTISYAKHLNKPLLVIDPLSSKAMNAIQNWIVHHKVTILNISGPSPVHWLEAYDCSFRLLLNLFQQFKLIKY